MGTIIALDKIKISHKVYDSVESIKIRETLIKHKDIKFKKLPSAFKFYINTKYITFEYITAKGNNTLYITFNPRNILLGINVGKINTVDYYAAFNKVQQEVEEILGIKLLGIENWKVELPEIDCDVIYSTVQHKQLIINALKNANSGHASVDMDYETSAIFRTKNDRMTGYDKLKEVSDTGKIVCPSKLKGLSVDELKRMVRLEYKVRHRKLCKILSKIKGYNVKLVKLKDLLEENILDDIVQEFLSKYKLNARITTLTNAINIVNASTFSGKTKSKLIKFLQDVNYNATASVKKIYGSSFYRYVKMLADIGLCYLTINTYKLLHRLITAKKMNTIIKNHFLKFAKLAEAKGRYNIYTFFLTLKKFLMDDELLI